MSLTEVSSILWRERELLELLVFKLEEEQLLLAAGRARWLTFATREVEMVLAEIKRSELGRAVEVDAVASALGLPAGISLRELAERVPAPWDNILREHRKAFLALSDEISDLAKTTATCSVPASAPRGTPCCRSATRSPRPTRRAARACRSPAAPSS